MLRTLGPNFPVRSVVPDESIQELMWKLCPSVFLLPQHLSSITSAFKLRDYRQEWYKIGRNGIKPPPVDINAWYMTPVLCKRYILAEWSVFFLPQLGIQTHSTQGPEDSHSTSTDFSGKRAICATGWVCMHSYSVSHRKSVSLPTSLMFLNPGSFVSIPFLFSELLLISLLQGAEEGIQEKKKKKKTHPENKQDTLSK